MSNQKNKAKTYEPGTLAFLVILGMSLGALGVLIFLSVIGMKGALFEGIRIVVYGLCGCLGFGLAIFFIWLGILVAFSSAKKMPKRGIIFYAILFLTVMALFNLLSKVGDTRLLELLAKQNTSFHQQNPDGFVPLFVSTYEFCSPRGVVGGALGIVLLWPLWKFLGFVPALLLLFILAIFCLMFITHFDFVGLWHNFLANSQERREQKRAARAQESNEDFLPTPEDYRTMIETPAYARRNAAVQQNYPQAAQNGGMLYQQQTMDFGNAYSAQPAPQNGWGFAEQQPAAQFGAAYSQPAAPMISEAPNEYYQLPPHGEFQDELIFPQQPAKNSWFNKKKKEEPAARDHRKKWVNNGYSLEPRLPQVSVEQITSPAEEEMYQNRDKDVVIRNLEMLRQRKQELAENIEMSRIAAQQQKVNATLTAAPVPAPAAEPVSEPAPEPVQSPEPAATVESLRQNAYRRPEPAEPAEYAEPAPLLPLDDENTDRREVDSALITSENSHYVFPPVDFLKQSKTVPQSETRIKDEENALRLENTLNSFDIPAKVQRVTHGPSVTRFELGLVSSGINVKKIMNISNNIALEMAANGPVRFEVPIKGTNLFGIEIPNQKVQTITLREVLLSPEMQNSKSPLTVALGKDVAGKPILCDLAKMPHLLIAGQTGSGKSVCINTIINSLLYRASPDDVRMILIDPKIVELQGYNEIPHLLVPVISDPMKASGALAWAIDEMQNRYKAMHQKRVRDISAYNEKLEPGEAKLPRIVIIIDELADLMMVTKKAVEESITRLAQLARAAGIHMVVATQRPTVDVVTGLIKSNIPSRIAFSVASSTDSRTILDQGGAEKLLGYGDMFFAPTGISAPVRVQGCFMSDEEIESVVNFIAAHSAPAYNPDIIEALEKDESASVSTDDTAEDGSDDRFLEAVEIVVNAQQASISMLQRRMKIGYARAGRLVDEMANRGIVSQSAGSKPREVLITVEEFERIKDSLQ